MEIHLSGGVQRGTTVSGHFSGESMLRFSLVTLLSIPHGFFIQDFFFLI